MGTKSVCSPVTKSSNGFGHTNLDHSRTHEIEKTRKNGFGPFSYKFFVCIRVGLTQQTPTMHYCCDSPVDFLSFSRFPFSALPFVLVLFLALFSGQENSTLLRDVKVGLLFFTLRWMRSRAVTQKSSWWPALLQMPPDHTLQTPLNNRRFSEQKAMFLFYFLCRCFPPTLVDQKANNYFSIVWCSVLEVLQSTLSKTGNTLVAWLKSVSESNSALVGWQRK